MKFYRLDQNRYRQEFYHYILPVTLFLFPAVVLAMLLLKALGYIYLSPFMTLPVLALICLAVVVLSIFSMYLRFKDSWKSYILILDGEYLIRRLGRLPEIAVRLGEIKQVIKDPRRGIEIRGIGKKRIYIPNALDHFSDIEKMLAELDGIQFIRRRIFFVIWFAPKYG